MAGTAASWPDPRLKETFHGLAAEVVRTLEATLEAGRWSRWKGRESSPES